jgi:spore coat polysaccharide biosynthesis protein SpsF
MNIGAIIFSRFDSRRLPGKAMLDIQGRPLLGRVIDRTKKIKNIQKIIVATSNRDIDNIISDFTINENIDCYRGSFKDVALRAIEVCKKYNLEAFVRICGDRPFFDSTAITYLISKYKKNLSDLTTTVGTGQMPAGFTCEIISTKALCKAYVNFDIYEQEHLTAYFYKNSSNFLINRVSVPNYDQYDNKLRLVVDNQEDLDRARWIAAHIKNVLLEDDYISQVFFLAKKWEQNNLKEKEINN